MTARKGSISDLKKVDQAYFGLGPLSQSHSTTDPKEGVD